MSNCPCRHIESAMSTDDGLWPLPRHTWWRSREVAAFARLCVFGGLCVDMWRFVQQWSFFAIWLSFDCIWRFVHCTNRQKHAKPFVYQSSQVYQDCTNSVPTVYQSLKTVKSTSTSTSTRQSKQQKMTIGVPIVTCLPRLYQQCTDRKKTVKNSQNTVKTAKMRG